MAQTYTRQSSFSDGDTITAALFNDEYNQLVNAFTYSSSSASSTGHRHDGTAGQGGNIHTIGDLDFLNKIVVDSTNNRWGFYVEVSSSAVEQIRLQDGALLPVTDSDVDLGTSSLYFKDAYIDSITTTGNVAVGGNLTVTGTTTFNGGTITMGDAATDNVVFGADVDSSIIPDDDDTYDLGSSSQQWRNIFIDGTAEIDTLALDGTTVTSTAAELNILDGVTSTAAELNILDGVTSTAAELNILDGVTATATELNLLDGVTSTTDELNILDGVTSTTAELNILDGVTATTAELNILDGVTSTTAELNILDGVTATATELNALDGITSTVAELNILDGVTASAADINLIDGITNGTVIASKAIITDANKDITGGRNITISGELDAATLDISGDADIDGTLEADAITIGGVTLAETISDTVGAMVTSNTETGITVTYDDSDNTLDFVIGTLNQDTTGTAALATTVTVSANNSTDETIFPVFVDGATGTQGLETDTGFTYNPSSGNLTIGGSLTAASLDISGDVDVDGTLEADAITVNGTTLAETISDTVGAMVTSNTETGVTVTYDDSDNTLDFVIGTLNQDTTGNAATATALETARTIHGVSFDGTANIDLTEVVQDTVGAMFSSNTESGITVDYQDADGTIDLTVGTLNQNTTGSAATLTTARTIGGVSFDGSANITPTTFAAATFSGDVNVDSGVLFVDVSENKIGVNQTSPDVSLDLGANTDAIHVPVGTTAQRPGSPAAGYFRYNSTTGGFEGYTDEWGAIAGGGGGTAPVIDTMTGDGSDTTLSLSAAPTNENATFVTLDGVLQHKDTYSVSGSTLTFSTAPPSGVKVECITLTTTSISTATTVQDADADTKIQVEESSDEDTIRMDIAGTEVLTLTNSAMTLKGTTPKITIGDGGAEDTALIFDGNAQDFYIGLDDSADDLIIGKGSTVGTTPALTIDENLLATFAGAVTVQGAFTSIGIDDNADTNVITIDTSERVGLGTTSPSAPLHILKSSSETNLIVQSNTGGTGSAIGGRLRLQLGAQTNTGSGAADTQAGDTLGQIMFEGQGTDYAFQGGNIKCIVQTGDGDDGRSNQGTYMSFETIDVGSVSPAERMRIDQSGNVGIGSTPVSTLRNDVHSTEKGLQIGRAAMLFSDSGVTTDLQNNSHLNNDDDRVAMTGTLGGSFYQQYGGIHGFYTAPAVAAPNTQTHTLRFRIALDGTLAGTSTSISSLSDERAKKNIEDYTGGLDLIKSLRPRTFEFKDTTGVRKTGTQRGFIAQEILEQDSYWVTEEDASDNKDAEYEYTKDTEKRYLTTLNDKDAVLISAIKELHEQVEALQAEINTLKGE